MEQVTERKIMKAHTMQLDLHYVPRVGTHEILGFIPFSLRAQVACFEEEETWRTFLLIVRFQLP